MAAAAVSSLVRCEVKGESVFPARLHPYRTNQFYRHTATLQLPTVMVSVRFGKAPSGVHNESAMTLFRTTGGTIVDGSLPLLLSLRCRPDEKTVVLVYGLQQLGSRLVVVPAINDGGVSRVMPMMAGSDVQRRLGSR